MKCLTARTLRLSAESWADMFTIIGTWRMSYAGMAEATAMLAADASADDAAIHAVQQVEQNPEYVSVGYGGLPARDGHVYLDASFMDGQTLRYGALMAAENLQSPVEAARLLCGRETNCVLAGRGAEQFAISAGLPMRDMRTEKASAMWREAVQQMKDQAPLTAYRGHDTVCVLSLDRTGRMVSATSTSGLFMKEPGRVGDSPIIGSGFYCDAKYGAAAATGLGEDIMRGCLSYELVSLMKRGMSAQQAAEEALAGLVERKLAMGEDKGSISLIALSADGSFGASTTESVFPFVVGTEDGTLLMACRPNPDGTMRITSATDDELAKEP